MPDTGIQKFIFACLMVFVMVFFMTFYNVAYISGINHISAVRALLTMWPEAVIAFFVQRFVGGPVSQKIFIRIKDKISDAGKPFVLAALRGISTVLIMAPCMTLCVSIMRNGFSLNLPGLWIACLLHNFLFALCLQVFFAGPFVRFVFRSFIKKTATA